MNFDLQISQKRDEKQKLLDEMKKKKNDFLKELTKFTIEWFEKETVSTIKDNSEKLFKLGNEKAKELKGRINELSERSSELVQQYMNVDKIWWHENEDDGLYYSQNHRLLEKHENNIKLMFGELGSIFIEYGLVDAKSNIDRNRTGSWIKRSVVKGSKVVYDSFISYSNELRVINNDYIDLISKAQEINKQLKNLEDKKMRDNVEDWWKSL